MDDTQWVKGSFLDNLCSITTKVGMQNLGLAFSLARVNWSTTDDRDSFMDTLTNSSNG